MDNHQAKKLTRVNRLIRDAFADLLEKKSFSDISVTDIIQEADVSRSAFYTHYVDKYALIDTIENEMLSGFNELMNVVQSKRIYFNDYHNEQEMTADPITACFNDYFTFIKANGRWWTLFITGKGKPDFIPRLTHLIYDHFAETADIWNDHHDLLIPRKEALVMGAWTYVGVISSYVEGGMTEQPEKMGRILAAYWYRTKHWSSK